jgi:hypothetical protein
VHDVRDEARLRSKYDVLIFGPATNNALALLNGMQGDSAVTWKASKLTPNIGRQASTDDMRGGLELAGILNLSNFVKAGGTLITLQNTSVLPVHFGMTPGVTIRDTPSLWAPGGVFRTTVADPASPLAYGYGDELGVYFNRAPVFAIAAAGGFGGGGGGGQAAAAAPRPSDGTTTARRSSRGGTEEQDVVQGRPLDAGRAGVEAFRAAQPDTAPRIAAAIRDARVIFRFERDLKKLLISGGLRGGEPLANAPALVDVKHGQGHVVLFAFNPFWRAETLGSYALVFNALLHHGSLDVKGAGAGRVAN